MPCGLVAVDVDRHHELERLERRVETTGVRGGHDRIARDRHERADLALARRLDLLGEHDDGELTEVLGETAHPAAPPPELHAAAHAGRGVRAPAGCRRGECEHRAALDVEVPGEDVDHIDQPRRERPVLLGARADAAVDRGTLGGGEVAGHPANRVGVDAADRRDRLGREVSGEPLHVVDTRHQSVGLAEVHETFGEERVHDAEEEVGIGARADEEVLVGLFGSLGPPRVDHHEATATLTNPPEPARHVGRSHQRAVRSERVRPQDQQVVSAIEIGNRHRERAAEHQTRTHLLRHLVDRAGAEEVAGPDALDEHAVVDHAGEVVRVGVAHVASRPRHGRALR